MTSKSQQRKGSDGAPSALDAAIQALNLAKDTCGISTAQNVFSHAGVLLTAIRVGPPSFCGDELPAHISLGHRGKKARLRRPGNVLR